MTQCSIRVDVYADPICPWCFIGKRRLERALRQRREHTIEVVWRPFQLNPDMPLHGMDRATYLLWKFGSSAYAARVYDTAKHCAAREGIPLAVDDLRNTPNTERAHRLIQHARDTRTHDGIVEALFRSYFQRCDDIGNSDVLMRVAAEAGLDETAARRALDEPALAASVRADDRRARHMGIRGIPTFIVNGSHAIAGAQDTEVLHNLLDLGRQTAKPAHDTPTIL